MATVLITDGEQRAALATARSLGRAGHAVYVCSAADRSLAGSSRHTRVEARVPSPLQRPREFVASVRELVSRWSIDLLLPISEPSLLALLPERETLGASLPFPTLDAFERICDKPQVMEAARAVGIAVPAQLRLDSPAEAATLQDGGLRFPIVLKPARSVISMNGSRAKSAVVHVAERAALQRALAAIPEAAYPVLAQERIVGPGIGVFLLLWEGEVRASFGHRRLREKPPSGGVSVLRESVVPEPELVEKSRALLDAFGWRGVAMVEYKQDAMTGTPYLMEINGRLWGSLQLAIDAGVDFPALLLAAAAGGTFTPVHTRVAGVRSRWLLGDVDHLIARMRHSREALSLGPDAPGRSGALLDFMRAFGPGNRGEVFRLTDPLPAVREALDWVRGR